MVDQFIDLTGDMFTEMVKTFFEKDEEKKVDLCATYFCHVNFIAALCQLSSIIP